jgi:hypothetical protein
MGKLSLKSKSKAEKYLRQIADPSFDQDTLESLLISIRPSLPEGSTREMADFVAHPERVKGLVFEHLATFKITGLQTRAGRIALMAPSSPMDGYMLIDDLKRDVRALGLDVKAISKNRKDLLLCYFGLLHFAKIKAGKRNFMTLKISNKACAQNHGIEPQLSIVSVINPAIDSTLVFHSDIKAKSVLGGLELFDNDLNTMLSIVRDGHSLKIVKS